MVGVMLTCALGPKDAEEAAGQTALADNVQSDPKDPLNAGSRQQSSQIAGNSAASKGLSSSYLAAEARSDAQPEIARAGLPNSIRHLCGADLPSPTPAAWQQTKKLVAQISAVLEWQYSRIQQQLLYQDSPSHSFQQQIWHYRGLRNRLLQLLDMLLQNHIMDLSLHIADIFPKLFSVVMRAWRDFDPAATLQKEKDTYIEGPITGDNSVSDAASDSQTNDVDFAADDVHLFEVAHARALGQALLMRLGADVALADSMLPDVPDCGFLASASSAEDGQRERQPFNAAALASLDLMCKMLAG